MKFCKIVELFLIPIMGGTKLSVDGHIGIFKVKDLGSKRKFYERKQHLRNPGVWTRWDMWEWCSRMAKLEVTKGEVRRNSPELMMFYVAERQ